MTEQLAKKGASQPLQGLKDQLVVQLKLASDDADALKAHGWAPDDTVKLQALATKLGAESMAKLEAAATAKASTRAEEAQVSVAKEFIFKLRQALPGAIKKAREAGVSVDKHAFKSGKLGRGTGDVLGYLESVQNAARPLDAYLKRYFNGQPVSAKAAELHARLTAANQLQETLRQTLPQDTQALYLAKAEALELIEEINRVARIAFYGQATKVAAYNKDVLLRARREQAKKVEEVAAASTPS